MVAEGDARPEKGEEQVSIAASDDVPDPGAEVIKGLHAAIRDGIVLCSQRPHDFAAHAQLPPLPRPQRRRLQLPAPASLPPLHWQVSALLSWQCRSKQWSRSLLKGRGGCNMGPYGSMRRRQAQPQ